MPLAEWREGRKLRRAKPLAVDPPHMFRRLSSQRSHFNVTFPVVKADVRKSWSTLNVACVSVEAKREFRNFTDQPLLPPNKHFGRKDFLPVEPQSSLSFKANPDSLKLKSLLKHAWLRQM